MQPATLPDLAEQEAALYRDGVIGLPGCFPPEWADRLRDDFDDAFVQARSYPAGTISRGPNRYYFAVHPEQIHGFIDLVTHRALTRLCTRILGSDYQVVELGFDVPLADALDQPWHRDFPTPEVTAQTGRLDSLAFNVTTVDVTPDLAPLEIAPGTQFDDGADFDHGMFPQPEAYERFTTLASRRYPRRGDVSARTGLTVHRGTANHSDRTRAVLILGVVSADLDPSLTAIHNLTLSRACWENLPADLHSHLRCSVVDELQPIVQRHDIEGLMMGG